MTPLGVNIDIFTGLYHEDTIAAPTYRPYVFNNLY